MLLCLLAVVAAKDISVVYSDDGEFLCYEKCEEESASSCAPIVCPENFSKIDDVVASDIKAEPIKSQSPMMNTRPNEFEFGMNGPSGYFNGIGPSNMGPGMMGPGMMGPGMMGPSMMGPSLMGPGMMGPSMMGPSLMGPGMMGPSMMGQGMTNGCGCANSCSPCMPWW